MLRECVILESTKLQDLLTALKSKLSEPNRIYKPHQPVDGILSFQFFWGPPADKEKVDSVERETGYHLPADYKQFLLFHNGASLFLDAPEHTQGILLGSLDDILQYYRDYEPEDSSYRTVYRPELCMIGSYFGFGDYFLIDTAVPGGTIVTLTEYKLRDLEMTFTDWLESLIVYDGKRFWK